MENNEDTLNAISWCVEAENKQLERHLDELEYQDKMDEYPHRFRSLPVKGGYPVPWFVAKVNGEYDFRIADPAKFVEAIKFRKCWVCGQDMGSRVTFAIGPMCTINRISADPGMHYECAKWSANNCPFLSKPHQVRRQDDFTEQLQEVGTMIKRNPGVVCLWTTKKFKIMQVDHGMLVCLDEPESVEWWTERRRATFEEAQKSVYEGLPLLFQSAQAEGQEELLKKAIELSKNYLPTGTDSLTLVKTKTD